MSDPPTPSLADLVGCLKESKIIGKLEIEDDLYDRVRLQKYVHIAQHCGLDMGYDFSLYIYGPYSTDLAINYYENDVNSVPATSAGLPEGFDMNRYAGLVKGKGRCWLEIASTMLYLYDKDKSRDLIRDTHGKKPFFSLAAIKDAYRDLRVANLVS